MKTYAVFREQQAALGGATHFSEITYADLTAAGATQTLSGLLSLKAGTMGVRALWAVVVTPFVSSDATLVSTAFTLGDSSSATRYLASLETNAGNSSPPATGQGQAGALSAPYIYGADDTADAFVTGTTGKLLNTHTAGLLLIFWQVLDNRQVQG